MLPAPAAPDCRYDRAEIMSLSQDRFDQDMAGGWRRLSEKGCEREAADIIRDWRRQHGTGRRILTWHEGQLRANIGETGPAIALFRQSYDPPLEDPGLGWNLYVDGSIAFLVGDRTALRSARDRLAVLPRPAGFAPVGADGTPVAVSWPPNLKVLDGLLRCWGQPYKIAYTCPMPKDGKQDSRR
jgi:hypothetical protein